jgi:hypothetical protein
MLITPSLGQVRAIVALITPRDVDGRKFVFLAARRARPVPGISFRGRPEGAPSAGVRKSHAIDQFIFIHFFKLLF